MDKLYGRFSKPKFMGVSFRSYTGVQILDLVSPLVVPSELRQYIRVSIIASYSQTQSRNRSIYAELHQPEISPSPLCVRGQDLQKIRQRK